MTATTTGDDAPHTHAASQQLALQLVRHLGVKGAARTCVENQWPGVLAIVEAMAPPPKNA